MQRNVTIICDMQFGSVGKGLIAGYLAKKNQPDTVMTAWTPSAGHTFVDAEGRTFIHCALANGVVSPNLQRIMIAPGSQVDLPGLARELGECRDLVEGRRLIIHENAAVIDQRHRDEEAGPMTAIGSTKKGCGACAAEKIRRHMPDRITVKANRELVEEYLAGNGAPTLLEVVDTEGWLRHLDKSHSIQVEGAQGFSLGINSGFAPFTTSRECTPAQIMSDCLIAPARLLQVVGSMRTFPIRVANRYNEQGEMVGWSGPCYPDQEEISFEQIGVADEFTTVTKLKRRVFTFSRTQLAHALQVCAPTNIFLNFINYLQGNGAAEALVKEIDDMAYAILGQCSTVGYLGFGPKETDIEELF